MTAIVFTLISVPSAQASGATDTQLPGRVTAAVAPEASAPTGAAAVSRSGAPVGTSEMAGAHSGAETCRSVRLAAVYFRLRTHTWQALRDGRLASQSPVVAGKSCRWAKFAAATWEARARSARRSFYRWLDDRTLRDFRVTPGSNAWFRAVEEAQRAYPNTSWWLKSCSASEGGWGRWVPNSDGAPPGGWMQMVHSTFQSMMHGYYLPSTGRWYVGAWKDLHSRGFVAPRSALSWYSPLGQALSSAYGMRNGRRGEWAGSGCR